jgi:hypothetical protein
LNWNLKNLGHTARGKWKKLKYATKIWNEKIWKFSFFIIWNETIWNFSFLKFKMKNSISLEGNEEIIYFVYATEIKLIIIPLYHLCIQPWKLWWYTINLSRRILSYWSFSKCGIERYHPP